MKKKKLELKKKTIASLSDAESQSIIGGADPVTTSISRCTDFICCGEGCTTTTILNTAYPQPCWSNVYTWCDECVA
jgi:hypothetical protein